MSRRRDNRSPENGSKFVAGEKIGRRLPDQVVSAPRQKCVAAPFRFGRQRPIVPAPGEFGLSGVHDFRIPGVQKTWVAWKPGEVPTYHPRPF